MKKTILTILFAIAVILSLVDRGSAPVAAASGAKPG